METLRWSNIAPGAAFHAARSARTQSRLLQTHDHDFAEVFWIDAGRGIHHINGVKEPLQPGSFVFMRPADCHGLTSLAGEQLKLTNIAFPREILDHLSARYFAGQPFWRSGKNPLTRQVEPGLLRRLNIWADDLSKAPRERLHIDRFLLNIVTELDKNSNDTTPDSAPDWLVAACRAIQKRENFSGGVERFLQLCGRSREHAARSVRQHLGATPTDYVNRIRIAYAQRQLEMGDQGILDIALDCGLENLSHFYTLFRTQTGQTPRAYRLAHHRPL